MSILADIHESKLCIESRFCSEECLRPLAKTAAEVLLGVCGHLGTPGSFLTV
jgi:hypothetical protein